jgi:hypothetical protein
VIKTEAPSATNRCAGTNTTTGSRNDGYFIFESIPDVLRQALMRGAPRALTVVLKPFSPKSADEVEFQAGQRSADLVHRTAFYE